MCGRTSLFAPQPAIERRFDATFETDYRPRYNVAPGDDLVVVHDASPDTLTRDEWGFVPAWADRPGDGPRPINARAETVRENDLFGPAFESRRALVVVDGYYEWRGKREGTHPYRIAREDGEPFAMAGVWSRWEGADERGDGEGGGGYGGSGGYGVSGYGAGGGYGGGEGVGGEYGGSQGKDGDGGNGGESALTTVAIVTTTANADLATIHDRMPAIVPRADEKRYLESDPGNAAALLGPYRGGDLEATPISTLVNDPANDSPAVIEPVGGESGQTGLDDFGG